MRALAPGGNVVATVTATSRKMYSGRCANGHPWGPGLITVSWMVHARNSPK
jgi:hypothetical protein